MIKYCSLFLLALSLGALAENPMFDSNVNNSTLLNPDCPLALAGIYQDKASDKRNRVSVKFENQSERQVIGIKVGFGGLDGVWDRHIITKTFVINLDLRPNRTDKSVWPVNDPDFKADTAGGIEVHLIKIMFANGATWEDDGKQSCSLTVQGRPKKHKQRKDDED